MKSRVITQAQEVDINLYKEIALPIKPVNHIIHREIINKYKTEDYLIRYPAIFFFIGVLVIFSLLSVELLY